MRKATFMRNVQYNFGRVLMVNAELIYGDIRSRHCTWSVAGEEPVKASTKRSGLSGPSHQFCSSLVDSLVSPPGRVSLKSATTLCHEGGTLHRHHSTASESKADVGGIVQIELAQTGEGIADCELVQWFVQEGDEVDEFQALCEVQSDKASVEITSRYQGRVTRVNFTPGEIVKVGETLLELAIKAGNDPTLTAASDNHATPAHSSTASTMSGQGPRATQTTPAVRHLAKTYGVNLDDVSGSGTDGRILKEDVPKFVSSKEELNEEIRAIEPPQRTEGSDFRLDSPESHTELVNNSSEGYWPNKDRISKEEPVGDHFSVAVKPVVEDLLGRDEIIPVRGFRRIMAKTMSAAVAVPHLHYTEDINVDALVHLRDSLKDVPLGQGVKLTYLPFLLKALSVALKKYPLMNSHVTQDVSEIIVRASHNVGVGIATSAGLVVPNIKNVQNLSVLEIAEELARLTQLAATNSLGSEDVTGGTITVSSFGSIGGKYGSPVLYVPEVAIVAIGRIQKLPRYAVDGSVYPASIMGVTWGADHRVVDGATVASFCNQWKTIVEQPGRLILNTR